MEKKDFKIEDVDRELCNILMRKMYLYLNLYLFYFKKSLIIEQIAVNNHFSLQDLNKFFHKFRLLMHCYVCSM